MNSGLQSIADRINSRNRFLQESDLTVTRAEKGYAEAIMTAGAAMLNPYGMVHGGALFTLADMAAGAAALSCAPGVVTLDASINFTGAARPGKLTASAREIHGGGHTGVYEVQISDEDGRRVATALFTMYFFRDTPPHPLSALHEEKK